MPSLELFRPGRRRLLQAACLLVPVLAMPGRAVAATILAVRTWPADEYTRITLELDSALRVKSFTLANPHRLVVDLHGLVMNGTIHSLVNKIQFDDPYVAQARVAQYAPDVVRLVFELKQAISPQIFTLKPVAGYAHRMVIDLYPLVTKDPLAALLDQMKGKKDPLEEILADLARPTPGEPAITAASPKTLSSSRPGNPTLRLPRPVIIALDPGHGGEDPGAVGRQGTREKDVVLAIARRMKALIDAQPGMSAFLTRDGDYFVPLHLRIQKARRVKADLFLSIHADAWTKPTAQGGSVFVLSDKGASSAMARTLARQQNAADAIGGLNLQVQDRHIAKVLLELTTSAQIEDSQRLAVIILSEMKQIGRLHKPHVERAGFAVLKAPDIPSVLVETAFISNPEEERKLRSPEYQQKLAHAIVGGIKGYFEQGAALAAR